MAYIFAAFCLVNGMPHFFQGICGHRFQSPFASPPAVGESSPLINVLWGSFNFLICYLTLSLVDFFTVGHNVDTYVFVIACFASAIVLAVVFGKIRSRSEPLRP